MVSEEVLAVSLGSKLKKLRRDRAWSQDELAHHAQIDGRQVSRYENDRVVPSIDVIMKMAKAYNVSVDYLLFEDAEMRPLQVPVSKLAQRVLEAQGLSEEDERSLLHVLDAIVAKNRLKALASAVD